MILEHISFKDFRCFYGEQSLALSTDPKRNVTLIHAQNGVGKTTILNAILWSMFGETTPRFEQKNKILNFEAETEGKSSAAFVELRFEHNGTEYRLRRFFDPNQPSARAQILKVFRIEDGNNSELPAPESFVSSVIPREMAGYFFFDGEHAESFSAEHNSATVGRAVRNILGCDLVETAVEDLNNVGKALNRELGAIPGSDDIRDLENKREALERQVDAAKTAIKDLEKELVATKQQIEDILEKLRDAQGAKEIQRQRETLERELKREELRKHEADAGIIQWVGRKSVDLISARITKDVEDIVNDESLKGRIPSPYNEEFVRELLQKHECICGRPLEPTSPQAASVMKLLENAGSAVVDQRIMRIRARAAELTAARPEALRPLENANQSLSKSAEIISELEQKIGECSERLRNIPIMEIQEREEARARLEQRRSEIDRGIGNFKSRLDEAEADIRRIQKEIDVAKSTNKRGRALISRRRLADEASEYLRALLTTEEGEARNVLQSLVNKVLTKTTRKHCRAILSSDFTIRLIIDQGQVMPKSGGENQLLSLAFTAALVNFASLRARAEHPVLLPGTVAPLVLDSPFAQLDDHYKRDTAEFVPEMARQVVLLVTRAQGDQLLLDALKDRIGAEYVLIRENKGARNGKPEDRLPLHGREYVRSLYGCQRDLSRIERVN